MKSKISRREFLLTGSKGLVSVTALPFLLKCSSGKLFTGEPEMSMQQSDFLKIFAVDENIINAVISTAMSKGGDYCDLFFEHSVGNSIRLEDGAVNRAGSNVDYGVGIRVLKGDQTGYSYSEEITPEAMKLAALTAASIANEPRKTIAPQALQPHQPPNYYPVTIPWEEVSIDRKVPLLQELSTYVFSLDPGIIKAGIHLTNASSHILVATSEGRITYDHRPMGLLSVSCTVERNGRREQNHESLSGRYGFEYFNRENAHRLADRMVTKTLRLFEAAQPRAGEMPVVLAAGSSGILLHEAIGHGMEADFNRKGVSIFADKLNKPVAKNFVTIVDNGTNPNIRGSLNIDDEGNDTAETRLVENGILRTYLHDRISAGHYQTAPTGSGRRQSFRFAPLPRMRNTYMLPGPHKKEEIIRSVKYGLYAESFTNGEVNIGAGDFTFYVKMGYLIEDGKITRPVKDINIIGNGPDVLSKVEMVADDFEMAEGGWTCGKAGQGVPVSMGLPTIKVSGITVGGEG
ncbi:MAG: TldD/PmbA family protein [FCB group bacterium]|nr:TldD/PmbA family protein [FCB group bacterium]